MLAVTTVAPYLLFIYGSTFIRIVTLSSCPSTVFRSYDALCNNLHKPDWGQSGQHLYRLLSPNYTDCFELPRVSSESDLRIHLPSPLKLSKTFFEDESNNHEYKTLMVEIFGEFIFHDIFQANQIENDDGFFVDYNCCGHFNNTECIPIEVSEDHKLKILSGLNCIDMVRTPKFPGTISKFREQTNLATSYLDASQLYGSNELEVLAQRRFRRGHMQQMSDTNDETYFPRYSENKCSSERKKCFRKNDVRMNSNPSLTALYTVFLREHNRIAEKLTLINPCWTEEDVFQQSRRLLIAELQHIIYNEFTPLALGRRIMSENDLLLKVQGFADGNYNSSIPVNILNEFASSAFRSLRSSVQTIQELYDPKYNLIGKRDLRKDYYDPEQILKKGFLGDFLRGSITQPMQKMGRFMAKAVTEIIYRNENMTKIFDFVAIDVNRGRDHGLPGYNYYRDICDVGKVTTFEELAVDMDEELIGTLKTIYTHVNDVDLYIGGVLERPLKRSLFGPTFTCIISEQFRRLKKGDRFWYETPGQPSSLTSAQLREIKKSSLARILCDNVDDMDTIQPKVLIQPKKYNERVPCSSAIIPKLNLAHWKDKKTNVDFSHSSRGQLENAVQE